MTAEFWRRSETLFATVGALLLSGGVLPVLLSKGVSEGEAQDVIRSYPLLQLVLLALYGVTLICLWKQRAAAVDLLRRERTLAVLVLLAGLSAVFSTNPVIVLRRTVALAGTLGFGLFLAIRFDRQERLLVVTRALGLAALLSLFFVLFLPKYGIMGGPFHDGLWRGIYTHKNTLGKVMGLGCLAFWALVYEEEASPAVFGGLTLSTVLLVFTASKTAFLSAAICFGLCTILVVRQRRWKLVVLTCLLALIPAATLALQITSGIRSPVSVQQTAQAPVTPVKATPQPTTTSVGSLTRKMEGRVILWKSIVTQSQDRLLTGYGFQSFWLGETGPCRSVWATLTWNPVHAHNGYIDLLLDLGVLGAAAFLWGLMRYLLSLSTNWRGRTSDEIWGPVFVVYFLVYNFAESSLIRHNDLFFALYAATLLAYGRSGHPAAVDRQAPDVG